MAANLAPVYVNDSRVVLQGDPRPRVSKIITAFGKRMDNCEVVRLKSPNDPKGQPLKADEIIDRTTAEMAPVYLKCSERAQKRAAKTASTSTEAPDASKGLATDSSGGGYGGQGEGSYGAGEEDAKDEVKPGSSSFPGLRDEEKGGGVSETESFGEAPRKDDAEPVGYHDAPQVAYHDAAQERDQTPARNQVRDIPGREKAGSPWAHLNQGSTSARKGAAGEKYNVAGKNQVAPKKDIAGSKDEGEEE